jgi:predicted amidophosphoribosyltransferase
MNFPKFLFSFRVCWLCGQLGVVNRSLCRKCFDSLQTRLASTTEYQRRIPSPFKTHRLFDWFEDEIWISQMVYQWKKDASPAFFDDLAEDFVLRMNTRTQNAWSNQKDLWFIPAPPRTCGTQDHASRWTQALSKALGIKWADPLERANEQEQKLMTFENRRKRLLNLKNGEVVDEWKRRRVLFADDIITSGATANAAFEALGRPSSFELVNVVDRPKFFVTLM